MIVPEAERTGARRERADVCVIGSGAGGAVVAAELAQAGLAVSLLEQGGNHRSADFDQREDHMFPMLFEDAGLRSTRDGAIQILQGRGVGGSTVNNLGTCVRAPDPILEVWAREHGVRDLDQLPDAFARVEHELGVRRITREELNELNRRVERGSSLLGYRGKLARHNRIGCVRSGFCILGCSYDAMQSMRVTYVPRADAAGARIWPNCRGERIEVGAGGGHVVRASLQGARQEPQGELRVEAPVVICSAGAIGTPLLLQASGLGGSAVGKQLHLHPSVTVWGIFPEAIHAYYGIPQAYYIDEFLELERDPASGVLLLPTASFPSMLASELPGFGPELFSYLRHFDRLGGLLTLVHDRSAGTVEAGFGGRPSIRYSLGEADRRELVDGVKHSVEILWASGAERVIVPYQRDPLVLRPEDGTSSIDRRGLREGIIPMSSAHPQGSCRMGADPASSVVGSFGELHDTPGVFVADASVFPTSLGVPPQITTAALADRSARHILDRWPALGR
ncbi:MAG: GMC family oxidoreductase [Myxococcales bacterium]|nr:GMC family oxidoreductase [Myxococcales bacterium]